MTMNITLSIDDKLVKEVRKLAVERDTTLTGLVREYLEKLASDRRRLWKETPRAGGTGKELCATAIQRWETKLEKRRPA